MKASKQTSPLQSIVAFLPAIRTSNQIDRKSRVCLIVFRNIGEISGIDMQVCFCHYLFYLLGREGDVLEPNPIGHHCPMPYMS